MKYSKINGNIRIGAALAMVVAVRGAFGDLGSSIFYAPGTTYTQNFDSLATYSAGTQLWSNNTTPPAVFSPTDPANPNAVVVIGTNVGTPIAMTGSSPMDIFGDTTIGTISNMTGWQIVNWSGNSAPLPYTVSDSSTINNTQGVIAFFDPARQATGTPNNMALGAVTASGTGNVLFAARFVNNGTASLNAISVSYLAELFHQDTGDKALKFGYAITSATANSDIFTDLPGSPNILPTQVGALTADRGPDAAVNSTQNLSITNLPIAAWAPGQALWLTWEAPKTGGGQGYGIDDLTFSASQLTSFDTLTWNHAGDGTWDQVSSNWTGSALVFANNYNASFGSTATNVTITIDGSGVTVTNLVTIGNSANTYTFTGGPINGINASLTIAGGGTVHLTAANGYGQSTNLNAGTLIVDNNGVLGSAAATLIFGGGTLRLAGDLASGSRPLTVLIQGGKIDLGGHNATFGGSSSTPVLIQGLLQITGGGNLNLGIQPTVGSNGGTGGLSIDAGSTVTLQGFSRSTATDFYVNSIVNGVLVLNSLGDNGGARFNFNSSGSTTVAGTGATASMTHSGMNGSSVISGTGEIQIPWGSKWVKPTTGKTQLSDGSSASNFVTAGVVISNTSGANGGNIGVNIHLNSLEGTPGHPTFARTDVSNPNAFSTSSTGGLASDFITVIGGTKNNGSGKGGIGPNFAELIISGTIYGDSDISVGNDYKSGGSGNVLLAAQNHYHGVTMLNGGGTGTPVLYLGVDNALPTDTDLVFATLNGAGSPALDLNGHNQTVQSLSVGPGSNSPQACVIDNSSPTPATLIVNGSVSPFWSYNGQINDMGPLGTDVLGSNFTAYGGSTVSLIKGGSSTMVLGQFIDSGAGHSTISTYSGGTTARGGVLSIAFDGAMGNATGSLTFDGGIIAVQAPDLAYTVQQSVTWTSDRPLTVTANGGTINTPTFTAKDSSSGSHSLIASVVLNGDGGYKWNGNLRLTGDPGSTMAINGGVGPVTVNSGSFTVSPNVNLTIAGTTDPLTDTSNASKHVALVVNGSVLITGSSKASAGITGTGNLTIDTATTLTSDGINMPATTLAINGLLVVRSNAGASAYADIANRSAAVPGTSLVSGLAFGSGASMDIMNNGLIVEAANSSSKSTLMATLAAEIHTGTISSSTAAANPKYTLAIADNADLGFSFFGGLPVDANSIIITEALKGDGNLDGIVAGDDFDRWFNNNGSHLNSVTKGDYTGDALEAGDDFDFWFNNNGSTLANSPAPQSAADGTLGGGGGLGSSAVPEPASLLLLGLGAVGMLMRRKQRTP